MNLSPKDLFEKHKNLGMKKVFFSSSNWGFHSISREWSSIGARGKSVEAWPRHVFHGSWHRRSDHNMFQNLSSHDYQEKPKRGRLEEFWVLEPRALKLASRKDLNKFQGSKDSRGLKKCVKISAKQAVWKSPKRPRKSSKRENRRGEKMNSRFQRSTWLTY